MPLHIWRSGRCDFCGDYVDQSAWDQDVTCGHEQCALEQEAMGFAFEMGRELMAWERTADMYLEALEA